MASAARTDGSQVRTLIRQASATQGL